MTQNSKTPIERVLWYAVITTLVLIAALIVPKAVFFIAMAEDHDENRSILKACQATPDCDPNEALARVAADEASQATFDTWYEAIVVTVAIVQGGFILTAMWLEHRGADEHVPAPSSLPYYFPANLLVLIIAMLFLAGLHPPSSDDMDDTREAMEICEWTPSCDPAAAESEYQVQRAEYHQLDREHVQSLGFGFLVAFGNFVTFALLWIRLPTHYRQGN